MTDFFMRFTTGGARDGTQLVPWDRWSDVTGLSNGDTLHVQTGRTRGGFFSLTGIDNLTIQASSLTMGGQAATLGKPTTRGGANFNGGWATDAGLSNAWFKTQDRLASVFVKDTPIQMYGTSAEMLLDVENGGWWDGVDKIFLAPNVRGGLDISALSGSDLQKTDNALSNDFVLDFTDCDNLTLTGLAIWQGFAAALSLTNCNNPTITDNDVAGGGVGGDTGSSGQAMRNSGTPPFNTADPVVGGLIEDNCFRDSVNGAIEFSNIAGATVRGNVSQDCGVGVELWGFNEDNRFSGNVIQDITNTGLNSNAHGNGIWIAGTGAEATNGFNVNNLFSGELILSTVSPSFEVNDDDNPGNRIQFSTLMDSDCAAFKVEESDVSNPVTAHKNLILTKTGSPLVASSIVGTSTFVDDDNWYSTSGNQFVFQYQGTEEGNDVIPEIAYADYAAAAGLTKGGAGRPVDGIYGISALSGTGGRRGIIGSFIQ